MIWDIDVEGKQGGKGRKNETKPVSIIDISDRTRKS